MFLFGMQQPIASVFLKCGLIQGLWQAGLPEYDCTNFDIVIGTAAFEDREDLVMQHVSFRGSVVVPFGQSMDAHLFCSQFPVSSSSTSSSSGRKRKRTADDIVEKIRSKLPWLSEAEIRDYLQESRRAKVSKNDDDEDDDDEDRDAEDMTEIPADDLAEAAAVALADVRDRVEVEPDEYDGHAGFYPKVLGGLLDSSTFPCAL